MVAPWYHQDPIFFLHHLWRWNTAASEESTLCRTTMYTILLSCATCILVEDIAFILNISRCFWSSFHLTYISVYRNGKRMFQPSLLLWSNLVGNFLQHFHLYSGQNLITWLFTATRKHVMYSPVLDTLPSQIKLSLLRKK